jgi:hypothetical protein
MNAEQSAERAEPSSVNSDASRGKRSAATTLTLRKPTGCKHCGKPITWQRTRAGTFAPIDAIGFDHRERCSGIRPTTRANIRTDNHERAVKTFFGSLGVRA